MNTKVSVIVPIYNVEKYIKECLESLISQTLKEIEIILIDDCGQDNSIKIAETYAEEDKRITIIYNKKNIGSGFSRNAGIEIAKGEYLAFADPDDWVDLDFYEKLHNQAKKENYDIVKSKRIKVFSEENNRQEMQHVLNKRIKKHFSENSPLFLHFTYGHTTAIYKKSYILKNDIKFPNLRNSQDTVFLLYVTYFTKNFSFIDDKTFYYYRINKNSAIHKIDNKYFAAHFRRAKLEMEFLNSKNIKKEHYLFFIRRTLTHIHYKITLIPEDGNEIVKYKDELFKQFLMVFNNIKYLNEDKIENAIDVLANENNNILKKITKVFISGKRRRILKKILKKA